MARKYKIEGNFDFYSALYAPESTPTVQDEKNICLITRLPLTDDHVEMECGHKFNYLPLYNGLVQTAKPMMYGTSRLGQISCPFCRHSQTTLLPFNPKFKKVIGVNLYPFKVLKDSGEMTLNMGHLCKLSTLNECTSDYAYKVSNNYYCECHHIIGVSIEKQTTSHSMFLLKKQNEENKKAAKEAKKNATNKKIKHAKVEQSPITTATTEKETETTTSIITTGCNAILKSGPRKGQPCLCTKTVNNVCARHTPKM